MKNILLTNDDGVDAPGLQALRGVLNKDSDIRVFIVAPVGQRSASSHNINIHSPIKLMHLDENVYSIDGSPADCVRIGLNYIKEKIDLVVSGINLGENMGVDIFYSGTVAAAREAVINGLPGIASSHITSNDSYIDFSYAAAITHGIVKRVLEKPIPEGVLLNVNVPNLSNTKIKGTKYTKLGKRVYYDRLEHDGKTKDNRSFFIRGENPSYKSLDGSDFNAIKDGYISVTPLMLDATDYKALDKLERQMPF